MRKTWKWGQTTHIGAIKKKLFLFIEYISSAINSQLHFLFSSHFWCEFSCFEIFEQFCLSHHRDASIWLFSPQVVIKSEDCILLIPLTYIELHSNCKIRTISFYFLYLFSIWEDSCEIQKFFFMKFEMNHI
jgi:hypothetical protein